MISDIPYLLELRQAGKRPVSTLAFDWIFVILMLLFNTGAGLDIWSHGRFGPDQSVFSEYHLLFYSAIGMMGLLLLGTHLVNIKSGCEWRNSLPVGYGISLLGIMLFGISGVFDLLGHALWGFEVGVEALYSPSHFGLFIAAMLMRYGPISAMLTRHKRSGTMTLLGILPALISLTSLMSSATVFALPFAPLGGVAHALQSMRPVSDNTGYVMGIAGSFYQTAILFGVMLWMMRRIRLPFGSITVIFINIGLLSMLRQGSFVLVIGIIAGLLLDLLYYSLQPFDKNNLRFYAFAFIAPVLLWLTFYGFIILTNYHGGTYFTPYVWIGSSIENGLIGLALAFLLLSKEQAK